MRAAAPALGLALLLACATPPARAQGDAAAGETATDAALLAQAARAETALAQIDRARNPFAWAAAQVALGEALTAQGARARDADLLEDAADAYSLALEVFTPATSPRDWAMTLTWLGRALRLRGDLLGGIDSIEMYESAEASLRLALDALGRDLAPLDWATAQAELALALMGHALSGPGTEYLEAAIAAHRLALEERTRARAPADWAMSQMQLGLALAELGDRTDSPGLLAEALSAYEAGLAFFVPIWPHSQLDQARYRRDRIRRDFQRLEPR